MNLQFLRANQSHVEGIANLQTDVFLESEPMTRALGFSKTEYFNYLKKLYLASIHKTQCFIATDEDKIVGMAVAVDSCLAIDIGFSNREMQALNLSNSFFSLFDDALAVYNINEPKTASIITYVATDKNYLRMGLMNKLSKMCEEESKHQGYQYILVYTTNEKSKSRFEKDNRYIKLKSIAYADSNIPEFENTNSACTLFIAKI